MQTSYTINYMKIYFWQGISILMNFLSMLIVIPRLSDNPVIYGIYVVCISANMFLTYADLGFASAGYKYASEFVAKNDLEGEIKIVGFIGFLLLLFVILFSIIVSVISLNPSLIITNINSAIEHDIASKLLLTLALFSPFIIIQRIVSIIYGIRLEQYMIQRIMIGANILKVFSVFYFFQSASYDIVGYYLFCQIVNLSAIITCLILVRTRYDISLFKLFGAFKYSKYAYNKTKALAFGSLFRIITWIMYFELDVFVIAKYFGAESVAQYAIGFMILSFFRTIFGVLFAPFNARFNHFIALNDKTGLRTIFKNTIIVTLPIVVFPIVSLLVLMEPIMNTWVGSYYDNSVLIAQFLIFVYIFASFNFPTSILITAQEKIKAIYITSAILPIVHWTGIILMVSQFGILSFAMSKFIAMLLNSILLLYFVMKSVSLSIKELMVGIIVPIILPIMILISILIYLSPLMPVEKNSYNLMIVVFTGGLTSFIAILAYSVFSRHFRKYVLALIIKLNK